MTVYNYRKKSPKQWKYVLSKRVIRQFINDRQFPIVRVDFSGTTGYSGNRCEKSPYSLGFLEARVVENAWLFYICLWSIREHLLEVDCEEIKRIVLSDIQAHIEHSLSLPPVVTEKPTQLHLCIAIDENGIRSESSTKQVDKYSFSTTDCWGRKIANI